jgi:hypothetical protein
MVELQCGVLDVTKLFLARLQEHKCIKGGLFCGKHLALD